MLAGDPRGCRPRGGIGCSDCLAIVLDARPALRPDRDSSSRGFSGDQGIRCQQHGFWRESGASLLALDDYLARR